jgi:hypothetical protein
MRAMNTAPLLALPVALLVLSVAVGCGSEDDPGTPTKDASTADAVPSEGGQEAAPEASLPEAGPDTAPDVSQDVTEDATEIEAGDGGPADAACTLVRPYSSSNPVCNACAEKACCEPINACLLAEACDDFYVNCMLACVIGTDAGEVDPCIAQCDADYPAGKVLYDAAIGCADTVCAAECE